MAGDIDAFITRWRAADGTERAKYQLFLTELTEAGVEAPEVVAEVAKGKASWPKALPEQVRAVRDTLAAQPAAVTPEQLARQFKRAPTKRVAEVLEVLVGLGQVRRSGDNRFLAQ